MVDEFDVLFAHDVSHARVTEYVFGLCGSRAAADDQRARIVFLERAKNAAKGICLCYRRTVVFGRPGFVGLYRHNLALEKRGQR